MPMSAEDFVALNHRLGISRRQFGDRLGIAPNSATAYALGRTPIPLTVELACLAVAAGLDGQPGDEALSAAARSAVGEALKRLKSAVSDLEKTLPKAR